MQVERLRAVFVVAALVLGAGLPVRPAWGDPPGHVDLAAENAVDAAKEAKKAAEAVQKAVNEAKAAIETALNNKSAVEDAKKAIEKAEEAAEAGRAADVAADEALEAAKDAQAAQQTADNLTDPLEAASADAEAGRKALEAQARALEADLAEDAAAAAAEAARLAAQLAKNKATANPDAGEPDDATKDDLSKAEQTLTDIEEMNEDQKDQEHQIKQARNIADEEVEKHGKQDEKQDEQKDDEKPLHVPIDPEEFPVESFFDLFQDFDLDPILRPFPNEEKPRAVPDVDGKPGDKAELFLDVHNPNAFAVAIIGVDADPFLFVGDAITFTPFDGPDQVIAGNSTAKIALGMIEFTGRVGGFTAADFSLITNALHPGLGPDFSANFTVIPAPGAGVLALIGLGVAARTRRRHTPAAGTGSFPPASPPPASIPHHDQRP